MVAKGETGIKQGDGWERSNSRGVWGWRDGEMEVFTLVNVYVNVCACVGVDLPLAMHDAVVR